MNETPETEVGRILAGAVPPLREPADRLGQIRMRVRRARLRTGAAATGGVAVVAALALAVPQLLAGPAPEPELPVVADPGLRYQGNVLVLETLDHGPRLCPAAWAEIQPAIGGEQQSQPPPCNGPANEIAGWDWEAVDAESAGGATWGFYFLVGTWDGARFTLTEPARPQDPSIQAPDSVDGADFDHSPCPEPAGGWRPAEPSKATQQALDELNGWVSTVPEYAGMWLDQSYIDDLSPEEDREEAWNDPARFVLNMRFVGDPAEWEARVREIWGGPLCVTAADRGVAELNEIQSSIDSERPFPETLSSSQDVLANAVVLQVLIATPELQQEFDERYGAGAVIVAGWLEPAS